MLSGKELMMQDIRTNQDIGEAKREQKVKVEGKLN